MDCWRVAITELSSSPIIHIYIRILCRGFAQSRKPSSTISLSMAADEPDQLRYNCVLVVPSPASQTQKKQHSTCYKHTFFIRCPNITATPLFALQLCLWNRLEFPPSTTTVIAGTPCLWPISIPPHLLQVISQ